MNRIRELRQGNKWTQADLARQLKVGQNTISNWETGRYEPDLEMLKQLSVLFQCSTDYILGGNDRLVSSDEKKRTAGPGSQQFEETDIRLLELLKKASPGQKQAMIELLEQFQK